MHIPVKDGLHTRLTQWHEKNGLLAASIEQPLQASLESEGEDWIVAAEKRFNDLMPPKKNVKVRHPRSSQLLTSPKSPRGIHCCSMMSACAMLSQVCVIVIIQTQRSADIALRAHRDCAAIFLSRARFANIKSNNGFPWMPVKIPYTNIFMR